MSRRVIVTVSLSESTPTIAPVVVSPPVPTTRRWPTGTRSTMARPSITPGRVAASSDLASWGRTNPRKAESRCTTVCSTVSTPVIEPLGQKSGQCPGAVTSSVQAVAAVSAVSAAASAARLIGRGTRG